MKLKSLAASCALFAVGSAYGAMGSTPSTYGLLPNDVASAQALSLFNSQVSSVFYNPANLAKDERGELTGAIFHAEHDLQADSALFGNNTIMATPSQQLQLGLKTNLTDLTTRRHPLWFGVMLGVEKFSKELMAFNAETSTAGQYFSYGREPLFLTAGFGTQLIPGIDVGASLRLMLHADASFDTRSTLSGDTSQEQLDVSAKPYIRPIVGMNIRWGEAFCNTATCWMDNLETAIAWRAYTHGETKINSNVIVPGTIGAPGLPIRVNTIANFQPETASVGVKYDFGAWRLGVTGEYQAWSRLEDKFADDTIRADAAMNFKDIFIPRVGIEVPVGQHLTFTGGVAWEESPVEGSQSLDINYLDADKFVIGLGATLDIPKVPLLAYPMRMDFGYQYQQIDNQKFDLSSTAAGVYDTVETDGDVHVFSGSITFKF